jgi:hypothetical protein
MRYVDNLNKKMAHHCITTPFHNGCLWLWEQRILRTGEIPLRYEGRDFAASCQGYGIVDLMEKELDKVIEALLNVEWDEHDEKWLELRGKGMGLALALAIIANPINPIPDKETDKAMIRLGYA